MQEGNTIKCLDHGHVRLVDHMGSDLSVVRSARVSYNAEPRHDGSDEKLIHYLTKNKHTTPFEAVQFHFDIKAPIFCFRQFFRHRTIADPSEMNGEPNELGLAYQQYWGYNEVSARYTELPEEFYVPLPEKVGLQSTKNKQARVFSDLSSDEMEQVRRSCDHIWTACMAAHKAYRILLAEGCPRELARGVLPVNTYSHMFATVDLHNLFHFLRLRLHVHAQYEIRVYAEAMLELITPIVPVAVAAFRQHILGENNA